MRIPPEFVRPAPGVLARRGCEDALAGWRATAQASSVAVLGGRGATTLITLDDGGGIFVRRYRHGGLLGALLGGVYLGWPPRPWKELVVTERARAHGILAPEVLGAIAEPLAGSLGPVPYRGVLITKAIEGRRPLGEALRDASPPQRLAWLEAVVDAVRRLHFCGFRHPDLNATNLLVGASPAEAITFIDFDRAAHGARPVGWMGRGFARRRLARSLGKLDLPGLSAAECWRRLARLQAAFDS